MRQSLIKKFTIDAIQCIFGRFLIASGVQVYDKSPPHMTHLYLDPHLLSFFPPVSAYKSVPSVCVCYERSRIWTVWPPHPDKRYVTWPWHPLTIFGQEYWQRGHVAGGRVNAQAFFIRITNCHKSPLQEGPNRLIAAPRKSDGYWWITTRNLERLPISQGRNICSFKFSNKWLIYVSWVLFISAQCQRNIKHYMITSNWWSKWNIVPSMMRLITWRQGMTD